MKTQIQFKQTDGDNGIALLEGSITSLEQAKRELANKLDLPTVDSADIVQEDLDSRLRNGDIDPDSITFSQVAD